MSNDSQLPPPSQGEGLGGEVRGLPNLVSNANVRSDLSFALW